MDGEKSIGAANFQEGNKIARLRASPPPLAGEYRCTYASPSCALPLNCICLFSNEVSVPPSPGNGGPAQRLWWTFT